MTLPFTPVGSWFSFVAPPPVMLGSIGLIVAAYLACAELLKPAAVRLRQRQ
jgi:P-type Mg2+ transporter